MKKSPSRYTKPNTAKSDRGSSTQPHWTADASLQVPERWNWHFRALSRLRDHLIAERNEALEEAVEPVEPHSMHPADSATDEFDHELALSQLSAEQDALYEVDAALKRILEGTYGICEQSHRRISMKRLKAIPWTRFAKDVEARLEKAGEILRPRLGTLRSVRGTSAALTPNERLPRSGKEISNPRMKTTRDLHEP